MIKQVAVLSWVPTVTLAGLLFASISGPAIASPDCSKLKGCERKFCEIKRQLDIAHENGNERKADGLASALEHSKESCTDKALREDLIDKIDEAEKDIAEYESDLKEAEQSEKKDKVHKYRLKIEEERNKIDHLEEDLSRLN